MIAYFNFVNEGGEQDWQEVESRIEVFADKWYLRAKALKEIHMLCLQLEKIMGDDVLTDYKPTVSFKGQFDELNKRQEQSLQQAIATGLVENMARRQSVYDQKGNLIEKPKKQFYECQQNL